MTSTSRDELRAFYQAAFKPIMEQVGKAPSPGTMNPSIPINTYAAHDDMMSSGLGGMSLNPNVNAQPSSPPKPTVPLPSIKPSIVTPLIFELKTKLAKLEKELYLENGDQMKQTLDALLVRLDSSDLDHVIEALDPLNHILSKELIYSYEPYLKRSVDRLVLLSAKQYQLFFTDYLKIVDLKNPEQVNRIQKFFDGITKALRNLLVVDKLKYGAEVSRETLHELMLSIVPYLAFRPNGTQKSIHAIQFQNIGNLVSDLLDGHDNQAAEYYYEYYVIKPNRLIVAAVVLRLLHDFIVDSHSTQEYLVVKQQAKLSTDALTRLINAHVLDFYSGIAASKEATHMKAFVYEIYSLFELASEMKTSPLDDNNLGQVLPALREYIRLIFKELGSEVAWSHFEMVDKELTEARRDPREVALFKFLAGKGYARSGVQSEVVKDTSESQVNQKSVESNETQQQQDPKDNPEESVPGTVIPETSVKSTDEVQQLEDETKDIRNDDLYQAYKEAFFNAFRDPDELHYPIESIASTCDPLDSDSDSDVVILDLDDDGNESCHQAILKPTKVVAAAPKPVKEAKVVEPTITPSVVVEEDSEKSFEVLKAPEQEAPDVVKMVLVSAPETAETKESDEPTVETSTVETTTSTTSSTSSTSSLTKKSKKEIYAEVQKLHQDLAKSQQMLHELLAKLAINQKIN